MKNIKYDPEIFNIQNGIFIHSSSSNLNKLIRKIISLCKEDNGNKILKIRAYNKIIFISDLQEELNFREIPYTYNILYEELKIGIVTLKFL